MHRRRRAVPWGGVQSGRGGSHMWHQSKARTTQEPEGRRAAVAGRRHGGEEERRAATLGSGGELEMPASERPNTEGGVTEHGHNAAVISV
jgi:hypothetical protein